jgi:hypothetical protein
MDRRKFLLEREHDQYLDDAVERGIYDNRSKAVRQALTVQMQANGYDHRGQRTGSRLAWAFNKAAWGLVLVAVGWALATVFSPVSWRMPVVVFAIAAALAGLVGQVLAEYQPAISEWLGLSDRGESA